MSDRNVRKTRVCRECGEETMATARELKQHASVCAFEKRTGLVVVQRPDLSIKVYKDLSGLKL